MFYYQHHIGDFDLATRHLSRLERSIYRDLIEVYYDTEKQLTLDEQALCRRIIARSTEEVAAVQQVLNEFFLKTPDGWYHDRCEEELDKYRTSNSQKSAAGKASAAKRALKRQQALNGNSTDVERMCNGSATNHKPKTTNHKPITEKTKGAPPPALPDWLPMESWDGYIEMRKRMKKPPTDRAVNILIAKLEGWMRRGLNIAEILDQSTSNNWIDIYEPKQQFNSPKKPEKFDPTAYVNRNKVKPDDNIIDIN